MNEKEKLAYFAGLIDGEGSMRDIIIHYLGVNQNWLIL